MELTPTGQMEHLKESITSYIESQYRILTLYLLRDAARAVASGCGRPNDLWSLETVGQLGRRTRS